MMAVVKDGQTLLDVGIKHFGTIEAAIELAINNNLPVTGRVSDGHNLELSGVSKDFEAAKVITRYEIEQINPATDYRGELCGEGIGYMAIEDTFIVS